MARRKPAVQPAPPARPTRSMVEVLDLETFAEIVEWIYQRQRDVLPKSTVSRYRNQADDMISSTNLEAIQRALLEDGSPEAQDYFADLDSTVVTAMGRERRNTYESWLRARLLEFFTRAEPRVDLIRNEALGGVLVNAEILGSTEGDPLNPPEPWLLYDTIALMQVSGVGLQRLNNFLALRMRVRRLPVGNRLEAFLDEIEERLGSDERIQRGTLTLLRILGPLLEGPETAFVEPQWEELSDAQLGRFVDAGISRERILLRARGPLLARIRQFHGAGTD